MAKETVRQKRNRRREKQAIRSQKQEQIQSTHSSCSAGGSCQPVLDQPHLPYTRAWDRLLRAFETVFHGAASPCGGPWSTPACCRRGSRSPPTSGRRASCPLQRTPSLRLTAARALGHSCKRAPHARGRSCSRHLSSTKFRDPPPPPLPP